MSVTPMLPIASPAAPLAPEAGRSEGAESFAALIGGLLGVSANGAAPRRSETSGSGTGEELAGGDPAGAFPGSAVPAGSLSGEGTAAGLLTAGVLPEGAQTGTSSVSALPGGAAVADGISSGLVAGTGLASVRAAIAGTIPGTNWTSTPGAMVGTMTGTTSLGAGSDAVPAMPSGGVAGAIPTVSPGPTGSATQPGRPLAVAGDGPIPAGPLSEPGSERLPGAPRTAATPGEPGASQASGAQQTPGSQAASLAPSSSLGATAPASATAPGPTVIAANPVTTQVVDRIAAMVTSADGTNRVTLKLRPEALGEVRIVLTVRDGAVQVQLSAHDAAARTLLEDAPELRRMLDQLGAGDARITVRDLGTPQAAAAGTGWSTDGQAGDRGEPLERDAERDTPDENTGDNSTQSSNDSSNDRARTPGRSTATDGTEAGANSPQRTQSVGPHRSPGVDLTM